MKKKAAISVSALLVCGALAGILCMKDNKPAAPANQTANVPVQQSATTRQPEEFHPAFTPVSVPEEMKQHYTLNPKSAQVITGNSGTILLIPDHAFTDKNGNAVEGKVKLELVEALTREDLLEMNMGTMSDQGMLETGGTIYLGARSESGEQLQMATGKEIEVEIPTVNKKQGMQIWEGIQNADGSVSWANPVAMNESMTEIPVETLAEEESLAGDEARGEQRIVVADIALSEATRGDNFVWFDWARNLSFRATYAKDGDSIYVWQNDTIKADGINDVKEGNAFAGFTREGRLDFVNFADKKFEHTNISSAEFRSRLPFIKQACDVRIAHCYSDHPNRPLWKSDAAAADSLEKTGCPLADVFRRFADTKQAMIDPKDPNTVAALDAARQTAIRNYSERMQASLAAYMPYKFGMKKLGWANIDRLYNSGSPIVFNARVGASTNGIAPKVSLLIPGRGIYLPGYKRPNGDYSFTHGEGEQAMAYPQGEKAYIVAESGAEGNFSYGVKEVVFGGSTVESVIMKSGTREALDVELGNIPESRQPEQLKILDDWFTKSINDGGCVCGEMTGNK
jgi:hypothetical protein